MEIILDLRKTVEENAASYYEKSKEAKKKLEGLQKAYEKTKQKIEKKKKIEPDLDKVFKEEEISL